MIETIVPRDEKHWLELRTKDVTSTEVAALFGLSPYMTEYELWHRHKDGAVVQIDQNERMLWGNRLQDAIATGIAKDNGWKVRRMNEYLRNPILRMGASFDYEITLPDKSIGLLEVKNVDSLAFKQGWVETESGVEAPPHIELQVQAQLAVSERRFNYIGALVGGNRVELVRREPDESVISKIKARVIAHWQSIHNGDEPMPDFTRDAGFIAKLFGFSEKDKFFDARENKDIRQLVNEYQSHSEGIKVFEAKRAEIKARILATIGSCEKVLGDGFTISAGTIAPTRVEAFDKKGYRNFRINMPRGEK